MGQEGVFRAAVCSIMVAFVANFITMVLAFLVFWPQSFVNNQFDRVGIVGGIFFIICARFFGDCLIAAGGLCTFVKPLSRCALVIRFLVAAAICVLTIGYCLAVVYFWIVVPGIKVPWLLVFIMWSLSLFPMLILLNVTFSGVYYVGDKRRDEHLRKLALIKKVNAEIAQSMEENVDDEDDKKPLISEA